MRKKNTVFWTVGLFDRMGVEVSCVSNSFYSRRYMMHIFEKDLFGGFCCMRVETVIENEVFLCFFED